MDSIYLSAGITVAIQLVVATAIVATVRQAVADTEKRVSKIEDQLEDGPTNFVPRSELQAMLSAIREKIDDVKALLHVIMARGRARDVAISALQAGAAPMQYSPAGFSLTEGMEALRLVAYHDDGRGVLTIGWGHTGHDVYEGMVITAARAVELLHADTAFAVDCVNRHVTVPLTQHQFDSLADFVFNEGEPNFLKSSLLRELNDARYAAAAAHFGDWVFAGGKRLGGLVRRRALEDAMFLEAA